MRKSLQKIAGWVTRYELIFLAIASPFMLFPTGNLPFLALSLVVLTWLCRWIKNGRLSTPTGVDIPIIIILFMALVGYGISVDPALSQTRFWSLILGITIFYGISNAIKLENKIEAGAILIVLLTIAIAGIGLVGADWQQTRLIDIPWIYRNFPSLIRNLPGSGVPKNSELINPRLVGNTLGMLVSALMAIVFFSRNRRLRLLALIVGLFGFFTLLLTQALAGLAGVLAAFLFLIIWRRRIFIIAIPFGLSMGILLLLWMNPSRVIQYLLTIDNPIGIAVAIRLDIWSRALSMIRDMPFTGIGLNTFHIIQSNFYPGYIIGPEPHAHNLYIQTALDLGLPGLFALFWLIIGWTVVVRRKYQEVQNPEYRVLLLGLIAGIIAYLAHGIMDALMLGSKPGVVFWILLGLGATPIMQEISLKQKVPSGPLVHIKEAFPLILLAVLTVLYISTNPESLYMNIGSIAGHKALYKDQNNGSIDYASLDNAKSMLEKSVEVNPGGINAHELLGRIYSREENFSLAINALFMRVTLDGKDPILRYYPSEGWLNWMDGKQNNTAQDWNELIKVYTQWMSRYPNRAETYSEISIVWQCYLGDQARASSVLKSGIDRQAQPSELLIYHQALLLQENSSVCEK